MTDPLGLRWTAAPQQTQWGADMMEALVPLGNDHTLRLYVEADALHLVGPALQRVNDMLARMEKAKADHDAAMADAARFRWLDEAALTVDMVSDGDNQTLIDIVADNRPLTIQGADLRDAVDKAMKRHNAELCGVRSTSERAPG